MVKAVLMSMLTAVSISFASCSDDDDLKNPSEFCIVTTNVTDTPDMNAWAEQFSALMNDSELSGVFADFAPRLTVGQMRGHVLLLSRDACDSGDIYETSGLELIEALISQNFRTPGTIDASLFTICTLNVDGLPAYDFVNDDGPDTKYTPIISRYLADHKVFADTSKVSMHPDWKLYVIGCSQGGANSLAIHKWLDTHLDFAKRWRFEYSYCASGPYSPVITFQEYFRQEKLDYPIVLPLTLKAMFAAYPEILGQWKEEDFYSEAYLKYKSVVDYMISSKEYTASAINKEIFSVFPHKGDTIVSYANSEAVVAAFLGMTTLDTALAGTDGHQLCCVKWMAKVRFGCW